MRPLFKLPPACHAGQQNLPGSLPADLHSADNAIRGPIFCRTSPPPPKQILKDKLFEFKKMGKARPDKVEKDNSPSSELARQSGGISYLKFQEEKNSLHNGLCLGPKIPDLLQLAVLIKEKVALVLAST